MNFLLIKIILFIATGILFGFLLPSIMKKASLFLIELSFYFLIPLFIFTNLSTTNFNIKLAVPVSIISWTVVLTGIGISFVFSKIIKRSLRDFVLPITFMNSAYLNFPLQNFILGEKSLSIAVIYNMNITLLHFTLGIYLIKRKSDKLYKIFFPVFAGVLGILFNSYNIHLPKLFFQIEIILKNYFIPSMLILVGWQLSLLKLKNIHFGIAGAFLRMFFGFFITFFILKLTNYSNLIKNSILLSSSLPSAINTFVLSKKFDSNPDFASSSIFIGTIVAIILYPIIFPVF